MITVFSKEKFKYKGYDVLLEIVAPTIDNKLYYKNDTFYKITFFKDDLICSNLIDRKVKISFWIRMIRESVNAFTRKINE